MGNCAGCAAPQRTYQVERILQNSPIKSRLSNGTTKYYQPSNSNIKQFTLGEKNQTIQRDSWNENQMIGGMFALAHSKQKQSQVDPYRDNYQMNANNLYSTQKHAYEPTNNMYATHTNPFMTNHHPNSFGDFTKDLLSQAVRTTNIKLYADNPENYRQTSPQLEKSILYHREEDLRNSKSDPFRRETNSNSYSNQLLKSVQSESKKYLRGDFSNQQKSSQRLPDHGHMENILARFDQISQIRTQKMSRHDEGSLPMKKSNKNLAIIPEIFQEDHGTPMDIRQERKNNGEDVIFDFFEGFSEQIEPLEIPNFSPYFEALKEITQKS